MSPPSHAWGWRAPSTRLVGALLVLAIVGSALTMTLSPGDTSPLLWELLVSLLALFCRLKAAFQISVETIGKVSVVAASVLTALLWTDLGVIKMGARRHLEIGGWLLQPSIFWVLACHCTAASVASGTRKHWPWLVVALLGATFASLAMPELSIVPQVLAGLLVIGWVTGRRRIAMAALVFIGLAIALSALLPYVQRRWIGFLDPDAHARGAGYDYRALGKLVEQSRWWGSPDGSMPRTSSPSDDYWFAAAMWRFGRIPLVVWFLGLLATLRSTFKSVTAVPEERALLAKASAAAIAATLFIHAGYNVGFWPITAISAPFSGVAGGATAMTLFALSFGVAQRSPSEPQPRPRSEYPPKS